MSRIGRMPIAIPNDVNVAIEGKKITVKGPKGELSREIHHDICVENQDGNLIVTRPSDDKEHRSLHGLTRSLIDNMVTGVTKVGFTKTLEIAGVGYRAAKVGNKVNLTLGYSHPVEVEAPEGMSIDVPAPNKL